MIRTKKFLAPYDSLLAALGCPAFSQPAPPPPRIINNDQSSSLGPALNEFREREEMIDVYIQAKGAKMPAHRNVLAAASAFCKNQFTGEWGKHFPDKGVIAFEIGDGKASTLAIMINFAYGVDYAGPRLQNLENQDEIAANLDEILDVLVCADAWEMLRLRDQVEDFLTATANASVYRRADNVTEIKKIAEEANAAVLVKDCEEYIRRNKEGMERLNKA